MGGNSGSLRLFLYMAALSLAFAFTSGDGATTVNIGDAYLVINGWNLGILLSTLLALAALSYLVVNRFVFPVHTAMLRGHALGLALLPFGLWMLSHSQHSVDLALSGYREWVAHAAVGILGMGVLSQLLFPVNVLRSFVLKRRNS